jgi:hypothetical protein
MDVKVVRPHVIAAHKCAAATYETPGLSREAIGERLTACFHPVGAVQGLVDGLLQPLQTDLDACQTEAQRRVAAMKDGSDDAAAAAFARELEPCTRTVMARMPGLAAQLGALVKERGIVPAVAGGAGSGAPARKGWLS